MEHRRLLPRRVDEGNTLRKVRPGCGIVTQVEEGLPKRVMRREEVCGHRRALGQAVEFFAQL